MKKIYVYIFTHPGFLLVSLVCLLAGCVNGSSSKENTNPGEQKPATQASVQYKKPASGFNDTLVVKTSSAVFFDVDSLQLSKMKTLLKREEYETEVHNCFYLMQNARQVMKQYWPQLKIIETSNIRFLLFIKMDNSSVLIDLDSKNDTCGIFLFDRKKDPELVDMMNIDTALRFYFKNNLH